MNKFEDLKVPNETLLSKVQELCDVADPYLTGHDADVLFVEAMQQSIHWHLSKNPFYKKLLEVNGFGLQDLRNIDDLQHIPFVHANFFKTHVTKTIDDGDVEVTLTSSGTTGQKSQMFFDHWSMGAGRRMLDFVYDHYGWYTPEKLTNYLVSNYEPVEGSMRGTANTSKYLTRYAPAKQMAYALRVTGEGSHEFDNFGCISTLQRYAEEGLPVRIVGFPSFFYFILRRMKKMGLKPLQLSPESLTLFLGGWKGYADQQITKSDLYDLITEQLGIPNQRCRDGYGAVEHSVPYVECENHHLHVPVYSRAFVRDVKTLEVLGYEKPGFLSFVTPYITSVPAVAVMMGDMAMLHPAGKCGCGLNTPWFEILGRAGISKNKSCAVSASELLKKEAV